MKKIKHFSLMVASIFLASHPLSAQRQVTIQNDAPNSIVMVSIDDADDELIRIIEHSVEKLTLQELEALYYDMTTKSYIND